MATISSKDFFSQGPVKIIGNETVQKDAFEPLPESGLKRVASIYGKNLKESFMGGLEHGAESFDQAKQYEDAVRARDLPGMGAAAARGGLRLAGGVAQSLFSPVTAAVETAAQGYSELDQATGDNVANTAKSIVDSHPDVVAGVKEWVAQNPEKVKDAEDILNFIGAKVAPKATSALSQTAEVGADAVGAVTKATGNVVKDTLSSTVGKLTPDAEAIMQRVARIPKGKQASFEQMSGDSVGGYLDKRGIYGDTEQITQKLYDRFQTSKQTADEALAQLQGTYRATPVRTALTELEGKVERTSSPGAPDSDLRRVKELMAKERSEGLTMTEINEVKRMYERRVRLDYLKTNAPEDVARATNVDNALREWQMAEADKAGLTNLKEINKETQSAKYLLDAIGKENAGSAGNNAVGLTDWIVLSGGDPHAISAFLVKKGFSNKDVQSWIAKNLSKYPEKIGVPEAKFKEKLQLEAPAEGTPQSSIEVPIGLGKSQTKADINLDVMNAKRATPQGQEILPKSYSNSTPSVTERKGITLKSPRGMVDPGLIIRDLKGKFSGMADKFSPKEYATMIDFIDYAHGAKNVSFEDSVRLEEAAQKFLSDQGVKIPSTRAKLRDAVQKIIDEANFPTK